MSSELFQTSNFEHCDLAAQVQSSKFFASTRRQLQKLAPLLALALPVSAQACAVCMGSDDARIVTASNSVLWTLLSLVGFIFIATGSTAYFLWRKANKFNF